MSLDPVERKGILYALGAYVAWGLFPAFWKLFQNISSAEIVLHRWTWSTLFFVMLLTLGRRFGQGPGLRASLAEARKSWLLFVGTGALIAVNWWIYIYAVNTDRVLEGSLGYFLSPLVQVLLGAWILGEKITSRQKTAAALALAGVVTIAFGSEAGLRGLPWISLVLAGTFSFYGLLRKRSRIEPLAASTFETLIYLPAALFALAFSFFSAPLSTPLSAPPEHGSSWQLAGLVLGGAITGLPLLWYTEAGKRLPLKTVGFFQYVSPTLQFLLAVAVYGEPLGRLKLVGFGLIWVALAIYILDFVRGVSFQTPAPKNELVS